ncbi:MAG: SDR family oxidoreductase [Alphaproteobacteria bacterium]|nr:SDR family oxidoreductase [Alphaproteobacteria bacterium]
MAGRLSGKVALVTGGTRGIGEAIATAFAAEGARTIVASRKPANVEAAVARIQQATGGEVHGVALHVGHLDGVPEAVDALVAEHGLIDVLVNNAGTNPHFGPMLEVDWTAWDKTFEVNLKGPFALTRAVVRHLLAAERPGSIVNTSSILGIRSAPLQGVYGLTKAALIAMTQTLAIELGGGGIRVNALAPGLVETRLAAALTASPELREAFAGRTAMGDIAQPEDLAGAAVFLASDESRYVTGHTLAVDGGYTIR